MGGDFVFLAFSKNFSGGKARCGLENEQVAACLEGIWLRTEFLLT